MEVPKVGDRVSLNGKEYIVEEIDEESGMASLTSGDDVVEDVPVESLSPDEDLED